MRVVGERGCDVSLYARRTTEEARSSYASPSWLNVILTIVIPPDHPTAFAGQLAIGGRSAPSRLFPLTPSCDALTLLSIVRFNLPFSVRRGVLQNSREAKTEGSACLTAPCTGSEQIGPVPAAYI